MGAKNIEKNYPLRKKNIFLLFASGVIIALAAALIIPPFFERDTSSYNEAVLDRLTSPSSDPPSLQPESLDRIHSDQGTIDSTPSNTRDRLTSPKP